MRPPPAPSSTYLALLDQVRRNPAQANAAVELGLAAITERRENEALPLLHHASTQSLEPSLDHVIGHVYRALGRLAPAITAFDLALARGSRSPRLLHARARAALEAGLPSLDWFIRARAAAPHDQDLTLSQAAALQAEGEAEAADTLLTQAVRSDPRWLAGHEALARLRSMNGRRDTMMEEIAAAIAAMPQLLPLGAPQESLNTGLQPFRMVQPSPGRLVLFPSVCWHGTRPSAPGERLTVAFDID